MKTFGLLAALLVSSILLVSCYSDTQADPAKSSLQAANPVAEINQSSGRQGKSQPKLKLEKVLKRIHKAGFDGDLCLENAIVYNDFQYAIARCGASGAFIFDTTANKVVKRFKKPVEVHRQPIKDFLFAKGDYYSVVDLKTMEEFETNIVELTIIEKNKDESIFFGKAGDGYEITLHKIDSEGIHFAFDFITIPPNSTCIGGADEALLFLNQESGNIVSVNINSKEVTDTRQVLDKEYLKVWYRFMAEDRYYYTYTGNSSDGYSLGVLDLFNKTKCLLSKTIDSPSWEIVHRSHDRLGKLQKSSEKYQIIRYLNSHPPPGVGAHSYKIFDTQTCKEVSPGLMTQYPPHTYMGRGGVAHLDEGFYISWESADGILRFIDIATGAVINSAPVAREGRLPYEARILEATTEDTFRIYSY